MFSKEDKLEIERLKSEIENYQSQLKIKSMENEQLQKQYEHKDNELKDLIADIFLSFKNITEIAERNNYGDSQQKIRQIKEFAEEQRNYFAQLTINGSTSQKNRTTTAYHSNK